MQKKAKKPIDPNVTWAKMKEDFDLEDDEMPEWLAKDIQAWNPIKAVIEAPLPKNRPANRSQQAEAVLHALNSQEWPEKPMVARKCYSCGDAFRTSYKSNAYCSDMCRREGLRSFGIDWHEKYSKQNEIQEWSGRLPPYVIPPDALKVMKFLVTEAEELTGVPIEEWRPKHLARMNGPQAELVHEEIPDQIELPNDEPVPSAGPSLIERLAALRKGTGLGN